MRWTAAVVEGLAVCALLGGLASAAGAEPTLDVVATDVLRPLQLAVDGHALLVLGLSRTGDAAGEIRRIDLTARLPVDGARLPRVQIPFTDSQATLGSLAVEPTSRNLLLGEENGTRIYRLTPDEGLALYATGLHRLAGGSTLAFDSAGRLVVVDHVDPRLRSTDEAIPPGFEQFRDDDYRGPLVLRLTRDGEVPLPRRVDRLAPVFPRAWGGRAGGALLPRFVAVAVLPGDDLALLTSSGEIFRLTGEGRLSPLATLPSGQYVRINMASAPDGTLYVSAGFWVAALFRVSGDGKVAVVARNLADPQGLAVDGDGTVYLAESSFHRILRFRFGKM